MINKLKNLKDRNPNWLIYWSKSEDGKPIYCNTFHLIDFFKKNERHREEENRGGEKGVLRAVSH